MRATVTRVDADESMLVGVRLAGSLTRTTRRCQGPCLIGISIPGGAPCCGLRWKSNPRASCCWRARAACAHNCHTTGLGSKNGPAIQSQVVSGARIPDAVDTASIPGGGEGLVKCVTRLPPQLLEDRRRIGEDGSRVPGAAGSHIGLNVNASRRRQ